MEIVLGVCLLLLERGILVASDLFDKAAGVLRMSILLAELDSWVVLFLSNDLLGVALDKDALLPAAETLGEPYSVEDIWEKSIFWVGVPSVEDFSELIPFSLGAFFVEGAAVVLRMSLLLAELDSWVVLFLSNDSLGVALDKYALLPAAATLGEPYFVEDIWEKSIFFNEIWLT